MRRLKVLYVEDEIELRRNHVEYLSDEYSFDIIEADNGKEGYEKYKEESPDIILTDISMPFMCGLELIQNIRKKDNNTKIIVLSAHGDQEKLLRAIELNLISYQIKPVNRQKLNESLQKAIITIKEEEDALSLFYFNSNTFFSLLNSTLYTNNEIVELTSSEVKLLEFFIGNVNKPLSAEDIFYYIWEYDKIFNSTSIRTMIKNLRKKLPEGSIENIYGGSYKLIKL